MKSFVDKTKIMSVRKIEKYCHPSYDQGNSSRGTDNKTVTGNLNGLQPSAIDSDILKKF